MSEKKQEKTIVLLDSHAILHRAYHALPNFFSSKGEPTGALFGLVSMILAIAKDLKPDYIFATFDLPKPTYRHIAYKDYKAGRKKTDDDLVSQIKRSKEIMGVLNIPCFEQEGFEADDLLGTLASKFEKEKKLKVFIASGDMDTLQLVNDKKIQVYTLKKGIKETIVYDQEAVEKRFGFKPELLPDYKGFCGDQSDNIIGIPGIGEKTASLLVSKLGSMEKIYEILKTEPAEIKKIGLSDRIISLLKEHEEEAFFSKGLATIRKDSPLPEISFSQEWKAGVKMEKIEELFNQLDFRSLLSRARDFFVGKNVLFDEEKEIHSDEKEILIGLWLINSNKTNPNIDDLKSFAETDDYEKAKQKVIDRIKEDNLVEVFEKIEKPLIPVVEKMIENGIKIKVDYLDQIQKTSQKKIEEIEKDVWEMTGEQFNLASPKQLSEILFNKLGLQTKGLKKTKAGALSTREEVLQKIKNLHPIIPKILEHREISKLLSSYIEPIPKMLASDGRLHAIFSQTGTTTGRMSSSNPNLQNIPNRSESGRAIRKAFVAEEDFSLVSLDYSQIELRLAAILSGDPDLINVFKNNLDIHSVVASRVLGVDLEKVDSEMRRRAKIINFGILYGMGTRALQENLNSTREEAQLFLNSYFSAYPVLTEYLEKTKEMVRKNGYTQTLFGRRRYFSGILSPLSYIRAEAERMAINAPIQGTSADLIKLAMVKIDQLISSDRKKIKLVLQVHDELVYEIHNSLVEKFIPIIKKEMENVISLEETKGVAIKTNVSIGRNLLDQEDIK